MDITDVLGLLKDEIEKINPVDDKYLRSKGSDNGFEKLFPLVADNVKNMMVHPDQLTYEVHMGHHFPDIDLNFNNIKYGVELKSRNDGSWVTNGNSVFESITSEGYEEIFLMFGSKVKTEKRLLVKFAPYWQAVSDIKVTHSPRFTVDMRSFDGSVFESKAEYDDLRNKKEDEKIQYLHKYLRENTKGTKWYKSFNDEISVDKLSNLSKEKQKQIIAELCILFPDDLLIGPKRMKYDRARDYLLNNHFVYTSSFRDLFSSGGTVTIGDVEFPQVVNKMSSLNEVLIINLNEASSDFISLAHESWSKNLSSDLISANLHESYKKILDYIGLNENEPNKEVPYKTLLENANISNLSDIILKPKSE